MSDFERAKSMVRDCSNVERQAHELRERLKRERETNANG